MKLLYLSFFKKIEQIEKLERQVYDQNDVMSNNEFRLQAKEAKIDQLRFQIEAIEDDYKKKLKLAENHEKESREQCQRLSKVQSDQRKRQLEENKLFQTKDKMLAIKDKEIQNLKGFC